MKKILLFFLFSVILSAQKTEIIKLNKNIKDKNSRTKSLRLTDNRGDKDLGTLDYKGETVQMKFSNEDLKNHFEAWFADDNKVRGNNDIVILLEDVKISNFENTGLAKVKIKVSSFINRSGKYFFINRYYNTLDFNSKITPNIPSAVSSAISDILSSFIIESYSHLVLSTPILEAELNNYGEILEKNMKYINSSDLVNGVYKDFKSFSEQKPQKGYYVDKNKKGNIIGVKNENDLLVSSEEIFGYIEDGKAYKLTPVGFLEIEKDDKGYYIVSSRLELYPRNSNTGAMVGVMAGGLIGGLIGAAIDSGSQTGRRNNNANLSNVYIDSLTGAYIFEK
ncbi:hypothetical protein [Chryseobacterium shigense]|uniref:Glycine zipper n=1 Tax=Chryseobacterium shigense TaxID=297244 RepID=A0A841ND68_9FLAO|nr:hypothetical protein [Chryseobacterium shigense]MBB6371270.1 hypothetical protein [Chryseobacterium shigense]